MERRKFASGATDGKKTLTMMQFLVGRKGKNIQCGNRITFDLFLMKKTFFGSFDRPIVNGSSSRTSNKDKRAFSNILDSGWKWKKNWFPKQTRLNAPAVDNCHAYNEKKERKNLGGVMCQTSVLNTKYVNQAQRWWSCLLTTALRFPQWKVQVGCDAI